MDGTLVDSKRDIATAVNRMREEFRLSTLPLEQIVAHIGWGARNLVAKCILPGRSNPDDPSEAEVDDALRVFRKHYDDCLLDTTVPYPGIPELLTEGYRRGLWLGLVSNKPEGFCRKILAGLGLADPFFIVVGGDTAPEKKPHPEPLRMALQAAGIPATDGVMVGDSATDLEAAHALPCPAILVTWGLTPWHRLKDLRPDGFVRTASELAESLWPDSS